MRPLLLLAILAAASPAGDVPPTEEVEIFRCDFGDEADQNFDGWPDNWSRRRGAGYPVFLKASIAPEPATGQEPPRRALRLQLDGGALTVFTPHIPVSPLFGYRAGGELRTEVLVRDVAYVSLSFYDAQGKLLERHESAQHTAAATWTPVNIGPVLPGSDQAHTAVLGLHLRPQDNTAPDLKGAALFSSLRLARLPRLTLKTNQRSHFYTSPDDISVTCELSGVRQSDAAVSFTLEDVQGRTLATHRAPLEQLTSVAARFQHVQPVAAANHGDHEPTAPTEKMAPVMAESMSGFTGRATWKPPITAYGFYRIKASLDDGSAARLSRSTTLVVARPITALPEGEFGWSLPQGDAHLSLTDLAPLVMQVGIRWLKMPMWFGADETARSERLAWFAERVSLQKIEVVGVLDQPPASVRKTFGSAQKLPVATVFVEDALWKPAIDPVMTRLSLKIRRWQLGADDDTSFVGLPQLEQRISQLKQHFLKFGQEVQLSLPWPWTYDPSLATAAPWDTLTRTATPALTDKEIATYLAAQPANGPRSWMTLEPLPHGVYSLETRARDLVERMLAAKRFGAGAVFLPDAFDAQHGLVHQDGTPSELLLPWRTTALLVGGAQYLGSVQLPSGSTNHVFRRGQDAVMVLWNDRPTAETLYLGDRIEHFDMWGAPLPHAEASATAGQTINVGPLPTFVTGLNLAVAKWRIDLAFESPNLPSVFGREQTAKYAFKNSFPQGVGGEIRVVAPGDWEINPPATNFKAAEGEEARQSFVVRLKADAQSGPQLVRFDVKLTAERNYAFSVYRTLNIGAGDISIETATRLSDKGQLIVEQTFINDSDQLVSFNCLLFAPGRRRQRVQVINLGRGRHTSSFVLASGAELVGQTLVLRAEEIDGDRVLNYRVLPSE